jgi:hypothetical protein
MVDVTPPSSFICSSWSIGSLPHIREADDHASRGGPRMPGMSLTVPMTPGLSTELHARGIRIHEPDDLHAELDAMFVQLLCQRHGRGARAHQQQRGSRGPIARFVSSRAGASR